MCMYMCIYSLYSYLPYLPLLPALPVGVCMKCSVSVLKIRDLFVGINWGLFYSVHFETQFWGTLFPPVSPC